jgi:hypothetical protein
VVDSGFGLSISPRLSISSVSMYYELEISKFILNVVYICRPKRSRMRSNTEWESSPSVQRSLVDRRRTQLELTEVQVGTTRPFPPLDDSELRRCPNGVSIAEVYSNGRV